LSYVCEDVSRKDEDVIAGAGLGDGVVEIEAADGVSVAVELELGEAVVVIVTWEALTSMIEYPVVVTIATGGVTVTRTVSTVPDSCTICVETL
jgi:hypothetical protein